MGVLAISGPVRRAFGDKTADAVDAGIGLPADAQCWACGSAINLLAARPGSVTLSVVAVCITTFAHKSCGPSRVFTGEQYEEATQAIAAMPSPVTSTSDSDSALIVDGQRLL